MGCKINVYRKSRYDKWLQSRNRRKKNKWWLDGNRREKDFIEQQGFKVGPRGFRPQDLEIDFDIPGFTSKLEQIANQNQDTFIDTNSVNLNHLFDIYSTIIPYFSDREFRPLCEAIYEALNLLIMYHQDFLRRPNVNITTGVREELVRYIKETIKQIRKFSIKPLKKKLKAPLETFRKAIGENNQRVIESGMEEDPLVERIYALIPKHGYNGRSSPPSETDRKLIAIPFAASLLDGRPRLVLSRDGAVPEELKKLSDILNEDPRRLKLGDLGDNFKPVRLQVKSIVGYNGSLRIQNKARLYVSL